jgi:hypothetical protein
MADNKGDRYVAQVGRDEKGGVSLPSLNEQIRQIWMAIHKMSGRTGETIGLSGASVNGDLLVTGRVGVGTTEPQATLHVLTESSEPKEPYKDAIGVHLGVVPTLSLEADNTQIVSEIYGVYTAAPTLAFSRIDQEGRNLPLAFVSANEVAFSLGGSPKVGSNTTFILRQDETPPVWTLSTDSPDPTVLLTIGRNGLYGSIRTEGPIISDRPIVGQWTKTSTTAGVGTYDWDNEQFNDEAHFTRGGGNTTIAVDRLGKYLVTFNTQVNGAGAGVYTITENVGPDIIARTSGGAIGDSISLTTLWDAGTGNTIKVDVTGAGSRFGDTDRTTQLVIYRLN